jgi:hypothetical protein
VNICQSPAKLHFSHTKQPLGFGFFFKLFPNQQPAFLENLFTVKLMNKELAVITEPESRKIPAIL